MLRNQSEVKVLLILKFPSFIHIPIGFSEGDRWIYNHLPRIFLQPIVHPYELITQANVILYLGLAGENTSLQDSWVGCICMFQKCRERNLSALVISKKLSWCSTGNSGIIPLPPRVPFPLWGDWDGGAEMVVSLTVTCGTVHIHIVGNTLLSYQLWLRLTPAVGPIPVQRRMARR